jgi:hypothetical protein
MLHNLFGLAPLIAAATPPENGKGDHCFLFYLTVALFRVDANPHEK